MELGTIPAGASGLFQLYDSDTAIAVLGGTLLIAFFPKEGGPIESISAAMGDGVYVPAGVRHAFLNNDSAVTSFIAARPVSESECEVQPGNGKGPLQVIPASRHHEEFGHGIPRRWAISESLLGHPVGVGLTWGQVPAGSSGHYHSHPVDTAITILNGRVLVPFYPEGNEDELETIDAREGTSIFIPANWVHGPAVPFSKAMTYYAARPVGIED